MLANLLHKRNYEKIVKLILIKKYKKYKKFKKIKKILKQVKEGSHVGSYLGGLMVLLPSPSFKLDKVR